MKTFKVLYLTNRDDDAYRRLNELQFQGNDININIEGLSTNLKNYNNFYFGALDSETSLEKKFLNENVPKKLNIQFLLKIVQSLGWEKYNVVFATHWGGKTLEEYKKFLEKISNPNAKIQPSYWGTQSKSYGCNDYTRIISEIIELAYPEVFLPLLEAKEIIDIQSKNFNFLKGEINDELKRNIKKTLREIKDICDTFGEELC